MSRALTWVIAAAVVMASGPADAFVEEEGERAGFSLLGNLQLSALFSDNPDQPREPLYFNGVDEHTFLVARLLGDAWLGDHLALELNVVQSLTSTTAGNGLALGAVSLVPVGRSDLLTLRWHDSEQVDAVLEVDQVYARFSSEWVDVRLGRQPVNLASTLLFTPNDVFEPFSAQTFFREFKPGIDALRADIPIGELTQVTLVLAAGYEAEALADEDELAGFRLSSSAAVGSLKTPVGELFEVSVLGGRLDDRYFVGLGTQGELFEWVGVRAEGHVAFVDDEEGVEVEAVLELDHRFESSLNLQVAYFHHGAGFSSPKDYLKALTGAEDPGLNLGRHYAALAAGYELTPLLTAQGVLLSNLGDQSLLGSVYLLYSLSDESSLALTGSIPFGAQTRTELFVPLPGLEPIPIIREIKSEYGLFARSLAMDVRVYF